MENKITETKYSWCINGDFIEKGSMSHRVFGIKEELDWMRRQSEYALFASKYKLRYDLKRGEIYQIDWGINVNAEFSSISYGVVIADSSPFNPMVFMCPIRARKTNFGMTPRNAVELGIIPELKNAYPFIALVNQIRPIDKLRLLQDGKTMDEINQYDSELNDPANDELLFDNVPVVPEDKINMILKLYVNMVLEGDK